MMKKSSITRRSAAIVLIVILAAGVLAGASTAAIVLAALATGILVSMAPRDNAATLDEAVEREAEEFDKRHYDLPDDDDEPEPEWTQGWSESDGDEWKKNGGAN